MIRMKKTLAHINKPIFAGITTLEVSKVLMYAFRYDVIEPHFGSNCTVLMTDTDSLLLEIKGEDPEIFEKENMHLFDTSDYPPSHPCFSLTNKKKMGCFADDLAARKIIEYVGLKPKLYSLRLAGDPEGRGEGQKLAAKGVKYGYAKKHLNHDLFLECLKTEEISRAKFFMITSKNHQLRTNEIEKIALNPLDEKRYMLKDNYMTLAFGHEAI
jgi:hypothetical protein